MVAARVPTMAQPSRGRSTTARPTLGRMLLLHAYLGVAPLSGRVVRAEKQLASYYDDNYSRASS